MLHFAANYVFDGENLVKNSFVSVDPGGKILYIAKENEALIERPRMTFYNGIISPSFIIDENSLEKQQKALENLKEISRKEPGFELTDLLKIYTTDCLKRIDKNTQGRQSTGINSGIILLENIDLINLKLKDDTFVKILI